MNRGKKQWYLLAYDIRNPRRLRQVHAFMKKKGVALQRSVFLVRTDKEGLTDIRAGIRQRAHGRKDDVRLYPVANPASLWAAGLQQSAIVGLYAGSTGQQKQEDKSSGFINRIFHRRKK